MSESFWKNKNVLVTGGSGFVGSHVVEKLVSRGSKVRVTSRKALKDCPFLNNVSREIELLTGDLNSSQFALSATKNCDMVLHLAAVVGGIEYNIKHVATVFRDNMGPFISTIDAAKKNGVERFLVTSSACVYPRIVAIPTPEDEGFRDQPEETNRSYGWAKRMQEFLGASYAKEFGMKVAIARPYNCYGPRDNFNPTSSHVIPALIRRIWKTKERPLRVWGSGQQSRSFLFVDDFAEGLLQTTEKYSVADVLNIGRDEEVTISELVKILGQLLSEQDGTDLKIEFDRTKPEGQPRRHCDTRKASEKIGYSAGTSLVDGLRKTVEWYLKAGLPDE